MEIKGIFSYLTVNNNKYIFGIEKESIDFAIRLLEKGIDFAGFLYDGYDDLKLSDSCRPSIFNKKVYMLNEITMLDSSVIISSCFQKKIVIERLKREGLENKYEEIEVIEQQLSESVDSGKPEKGLIIIGIGGTTESLLSTLCKCNFDLNILCFCVMDESEKKEIFHSKRVIRPEELELYSDNPIVISSIYNMQIYEKLTLYGVKGNRIYEWAFGIYPGYDYKCDRKDWGRISRRSMYSLVRDLREKDVLVYGYEKSVNHLVRLLSMVGIEVKAVCQRDSLEEDGRAYDLASISNSNYEIVITDIPSVTQKHILDDCGFSEKDYICIHNYWSYWGYGHYTDYMTPLDASIGRITVRKDNRSKRGIGINTESPKVMKIITLGGSTSAPFGTRNRSWTYFFSEILKENKIDHKIINLAEPDCNVTCELMRLIRDGIWEQPDLVISYSGVNNMNLIQEHPFYSSYSELLFKSIDQNINLGTSPNVSRFEYWLSFEEIMQAICRSRRINFFAFLQPQLISKKNNNKYDADIGIEWGYIWDESRNEYKFILDSDDECNRVYREYCKEDPVFRDMGINLDLKWLFNYSGIFDNEEDVYIDFCHVNEKGNRIIARKIYDDLKNQNVWENV